MSKTTFIYALCEPGTRTVRYIGKSDTPESRLKTHVRVSATRNTHLGHWLTRVLRSKKVPNLVILAKVPKCSWEQEERLYIANARMLGMNLVNTCEGGEGVTMTSEIRKKIGDSNRGQTRSLVQRKQMSEVQAGEKNSMFGRVGSLSPLFGRVGPAHPMFGKFGPAHHAFGTKQKKSSSKFLGVFWHSRDKKWSVKIGKKSFGYFILEIDAAMAYDTAVRKLYGPTARTNFPIKRRINKN